MWSWGKIIKDKVSCAKFLSIKCNYDLSQECNKDIVINILSYLFTRYLSKPKEHGHCHLVVLDICSTEGSTVDFRNPVNPIEEQKAATKYYNSEVIFLDSLDYILFMTILFWK